MPNKDRDDRMWGLVRKMTRLRGGIPYNPPLPDWRSVLANDQVAYDTLDEYLRLKAEEEAEEN